MTTLERVQRIAKSMQQGYGTGESISPRALAKLLEDLCEEHEAALALIAEYDGPRLRHWLGLQTDSEGRTHLAASITEQLQKPKTVQSLSETPFAEPPLQEIH